jgi:uncharacterized protein (TIGR02145 family)
MPRLPTTDLSTDAIKAFLGETEAPMEIKDICQSDRVREEYFDPNYAIQAGLGYKDFTARAPYNISNFRNYGFDTVGYSMIAFSGTGNNNRILKYNNDEYWNNFISAPIRDMRTSVRAADGFLWVGGQVTGSLYANERGLFRWDGTVWTRFTTPYIAGEYVYCIALAEDPYMWIGTENGFSIYNRLTGEIRSFNTSTIGVTSSMLKSNVITKLAFDSADNSMWVGTTNGLTHITDVDDPTAWHWMGMTEGLASNNVKSIAVGPDSQAWVGFNGQGITRVTNTSGVYTFDNINTTTVGGIVDDHINSIAIEDDTYYVWAATNSGIQYFHYDSGYNDVTILYVAGGIPNNIVNVVKIDHQNRKWFGFDDHIAEIDDINSEPRVWGQWNISGGCPIMEFLIDYEPTQVINEVVIGTQTWMSENWRGNKRFMFSSGNKSKVYNYNEYHREYLGGLYTWRQINEAGFCPTGWHVPSFAEWWKMIMYLGGVTSAGDALKSSQNIPGFGWASSLPTVTNSSGFGVIGAGYANLAGYYDIDEMTQYWTSDENEDDSADGVSIGFYYDLRDAYIESHNKDEYWFPVRLIKNIDVPVATDDYGMLYNWHSINMIIDYSITM